MSRSLKNFSINDIDGIIDYLNDYSASLEEKALEFCQRLADVGIAVAESNLGEWQGYVLFHKKVEGDKVVLIATDKSKVLKVWYTDKNQVNERSYEVSPLLLAEFGSGWYADNKLDIDGVGQGTMPEQTHAFDPKGWFWYDEGGEKHHSIGERPTYPMYSAINGMIIEIQRKAKEVFGNGI
jgi:hypothetical protein